jgi:phosphatidylserine/phosphatidylglycerophosphate/cardiolipin synthase-like enzyme
MFRLKANKVPLEDLLTSSLFDERTFYKSFIKDLKNCETEVIIESPYMTVGRLNVLAPYLRKLVKKGIKVRVNTRYPGHHDELLRIHAWKATKLLKQNGINVRFFNDYHHRKIAVIDRRILWEGSLNILSQSNSREIMRRIESEQLAVQMIQFLKLNRWYW